VNGGAERGELHPVSTVPEPITTRHVVLSFTASGFRLRASARLEAAGPGPQPEAFSLARA
jgi:hypothetical protein